MHAYTRLKLSSSKVSMVVRNISESPIFLKKGVHVARVVSASLVPPAELSPEMEATLGAESVLEHMSVAEQQEKLLEKLNLDGLPKILQWLRTLFWPVMISLYWKGMSLAVPVPLSMRSALLTVSLLRISSGIYLHHFWRRCTPCSVICWMERQYAPASPRWVPHISPQ